MCIRDRDLTGLDYIMAAYEAYTRDEYWVKAEDGSFKAGCTDEKAKKPLAVFYTHLDVYKRQS